MKPFNAMSHETSKKVEGGIDVSSWGGVPYKKFSPFTYSSEFRIPVPGQEGVYSCSVEGIWQGLKVINGQTDFTYFDKKPKKRRGHVEGHLLGSQLLDVVDARHQIYVPSYNYYLENCIDESLKDEVLRLGLEKGITFYDLDNNLDIDNPRAPLAHSALLADYFNEHLNTRVQGVRKRIDEITTRTSAEFYTLQEALTDGLKLYDSSSETDQALLKEALGRFEATGRHSDRLYIELARRVS